MSLEIENRFSFVSILLLYLCFLLTAITGSWIFSQDYSGFADSQLGWISQSVGAKLAVCLFTTIAVILIVIFIEYSDYYDEETLVGFFILLIPPINILLALFGFWIYSPEYSGFADSQLTWVAQNTASKVVGIVLSTLAIYLAFFGALFVLAFILEFIMPEEDIDYDLLESEQHNEPNDSASSGTANPETSTAPMDDIEELARLTGRKVEDVRADLDDDGILNLSAGSDAKQEGEGGIDERSFVKVRKLRAEGGMAEVYQGKDKRTGDQVIWKQAAPSRKLSAKEANRALANEAEVLERLDHPRIPDFIESGYVVNEEGDRVLVLIMEHIDGGSLDDEMKTFVRRGKTQDLDYVIETLVQCCEALDYMADLDPPLYHRDIKPHNIMTHPERGVVLIDFGLAKEVSAGSGLSLSAGAHTAGWSPPERERAQTGPYTDVYSLGQVLWHMLTNEPAGIYSEAKRIETIAEAGHPEWLADLVNRATVPDDPDKRIQTVAEFRIELGKEGEMP